VFAQAGTLSTSLYEQHDGIALWAFSDGGAEGGKVSVFEVVG